MHSAEPAPAATGSRCRHRSSWQVHRRGCSKGRLSRITHRKGMLPAGKDTRDKGMWGQGDQGQGTSGKATRDKGMWGQGDQGQGTSGKATREGTWVKGRRAKGMRCKSLQDTATPDKGRWDKGTPGTKGKGKWGKPPPVRGTPDSILMPVATGSRGARQATRMARGRLRRRTCSHSMATISWL
jgi:hypothetical protein